MNKKIIHYCWFGSAEKGLLIKDCMKTWRKVLPEYEIREWNDSDIETFDNKYVEEAAKAGKWAFVSDYARLYALYNYGGIYLDTDVEIRKSVDEFLTHDFFSCYEYRKGSNECFPISALMGAKKGNKTIKGLLESYDNRSFIKEDGTFDMTPNTVTISAFFDKQYSVKPPYNPEEAVTLTGNETIYPYHYFCTDDNGRAYAVHHFNGSWKKKHKVIFEGKTQKLIVAKNSYTRNIAREDIVFKFKFFKNRNLILMKL